MEYERSYTSLHARLPAPHDTALKASELRYRRLFESAKDGILILDFATGHIVDSNPFLEHLLGYSSNELIGKRLWEIAPFRDIAASRSAYTELQKKEYIRYDNLPLQHKDGQYVDVEFVSNVYPVDGAKVIQCNIRDVTKRKRTEAALERSLSLLRATLESTADGIVVVNPQREIEIFNKRYLEMWHIPESVISLRTESAVFAYVAARLENAEEIREKINALYEQPDADSCDVLRFKDGSTFEVVSHPQIIAGKSAGRVWSFRDISERYRSDAMRSQLAAIVEYSDDAIFSKTLDGKITSWNNGAVRLYGYTEEEILGQSISILIPPDRLGDKEHILSRLRRGESVERYKTVRVHKDGGRIDISLTASVIRDKDSAVIVGASIIARDVTQQKQSEKRILHMAQHDALTGLPNRTLFQDRLALAIAQARRRGYFVAVLFIDLDHFKDINDSLGHQIGDRLLSLAAERLQKCLREGDTIARLGGDEFVVGLPDLANNTDTIAICEKILEALRESFAIDSHELHVSGSIGISIFPNDGDNPDALMRAADTAMYDAKGRGRDNFQFFTRELNETAQRRLSIGGRLHQALKNGELSVCYQPQVDMESGKICAAEALLRWHQPELGAVPTSELITVAEDTGSIVAIGEWVLREACRQVRTWREQGHPKMRVAVNISPRQFRRTEFTELTARILQETGVPADALEIEITEGVFMAQSQENILKFEQLTDMGVRLAVDDFGTGYSSLAYLQRFPIHTLKIDQSFVGGIGRDSNDTAIVSAIISMAQSLNLEVIAEGVETAEQAAFIKSRGCFLVQGFYFSKAVSSDAFLGLLNKADYVVAEG